jgi:hypothetical protein
VLPVFCSRLAPAQPSASGSPICRTGWEASRLACRPGAARPNMMPGWPRAPKRRQDPKPFSPTAGRACKCGRFDRAAMTAPALAQVRQRRPDSVPSGGRRRPRTWRDCESINDVRQSLLNVLALKPAGPMHSRADGGSYEYDFYRFAEFRSGRACRVSFAEYNRAVLLPGAGCVPLPDDTGPRRQPRFGLAGPDLLRRPPAGRPLTSRWQWWTPMGRHCHKRAF